MSPLLAQSGHYRLSSNVRFWGYVAVPMAALPDEGESLRGDDPAEQHAFVYRAGVRPGRSSGLRKVELFLNLKTAKALGYRPVTPVGPR